MSHLRQVLEYIWLDVKGIPRSKTRVVYPSSDHSRWATGSHGYQTEVDGKARYVYAPNWNYDGSSTGQADGSNSEVLIKPVAVYQDPFHTQPDTGLEYYLVLCDTWLDETTPHPNNTRYKALRIFDQAPELKPLFGIEQEYFLSGSSTPIGFMGEGEPPAQGGYYCGAGAVNAIGRPCVEEAFRRCLVAGLRLTGLNAEVAPSQWEFQVCTSGIHASDQLVIMRFILSRTAEEFGWNLELHPKPVEGDWNGSGCHTNFSTEPMRQKGGLEVIHGAIARLGEHHALHLKHYGEHNEARLTGKHETAGWDVFRAGVADRGASIRIPREVDALGCGYLEDRRPSSNMDPYIVTSLIFATSCEITQDFFT